MIAPIIARAIVTTANVSLNDNDTNVGCAVAALAVRVNARIDAPTNKPIAIGPLSQYRHTSVDRDQFKDLIRSIGITCLEYGYTMKITMTALEAVHQQHAH